MWCFCVYFSALTLDDEVREISKLVIAFLRTVNYGRDFEQQLTFYVEARAAFSNIDSILVYLVQVGNIWCISSITLDIFLHPFCSIFSNWMKKGWKLVPCCWKEYFIVYCLNVKLNVVCFFYSVLTD